MNRNDIAALMFTNLSITKQHYRLHNKVKSELIYSYRHYIGLNKKK